MSDTLGGALPIKFVGVRAALEEVVAERDRYRRALEAIRERREHSDYSLSDEDDCAAMLADIDRIAAEALKDPTP